MELILIAIVVLVVLAGMDADLWPHALPRARQRGPVARRPLRIGQARCDARSEDRAKPLAWPAVPRRAPSRRQRPALRYVGPSRFCAAPRWWWE